MGIGCRGSGVGTTALWGTDRNVRPIMPLVVGRAVSATPDTRHPTPLLDVYLLRDEMLQRPKQRPERPGDVVAQDQSEEEWNRRIVALHSAEPDNDRLHCPRDEEAEPEVVHCERDRQRIAGRVERPPKEAASHYA